MPTTFRRARATVLAGLAGLTVACAPPGAAAADEVTGDALRAGLEELVTDDGFPGALGSYRDGSGRTIDLAAGVGDLASGRPVPVNGRVRIASNTKMFTATVVLQLVGEGKVDLDAPLSTYLPHLDGIEGITVRHVLQHTSGLVDYDDKLIQDYAKVRHVHFEPHELTDVVLSEERLAPPGAKFSYSNANYVLAGLVVQKVTGRPVGEQITDRIIRPLKLRDTYWPALGDQTIRGRHPHGYWPAASGGRDDVTEMDPSMGWAAGQLIGTPRDLVTFMTALLDGDLLEPAQLAEMRKTVPAPDFDLTGGATYGLGLGTFRLSCGGTAWTHGGDAPGYVTRNAITDDGRAAAIAVTANPTSLPQGKSIESALDAALCG